jgi:fructose-bisphosphate aldolase class I
MDHSKLYETIEALLADGKGIVAADESTRTMNKRLASIDVPQEAENRRKFRQLMFTAPGIEEYVSGVIMYDSSIRNLTDDGMAFPDVLMSRGIVPGIKVDTGTVALHNFPEEVITEGLDGLEDRLKEYYDFGARFAKWRAVITITDELPSDECIIANAHVLARYAAICQSVGIVPMVEPEVLLSGSHDISRAEAVTMHTLQILFNVMRTYKVDLKAVILKSSMVLAGDKYAPASTAAEVADTTLRTFHLSVPHDVAAIVFLSGGQETVRATQNLQEIASRGVQPWKITFSYSRAIEEPILATWQGKDENIEAAQKVMLQRVKMNGLAQQGAYTGEDGSGGA